MKAIVTRYYGPTNTRGARIVASAHGVRSVSIGYPHELDSEDAHKLAAKTMCDKYAWQKRGLVMGTLPNGDNVFVMQNLCD